MRVSALLIEFEIIELLISDQTFGRQVHISDSLMKTTFLIKVH